MTLLIFTLLLLLLTNGFARPWQIEQTSETYTGTFVPHLVEAFDSWAASVLSQPQVPLVGAGAALIYLGYAGAAILTNQFNPSSQSFSARALTSTDVLTDFSTELVHDALRRTESGAAFQEAAGRALQHGANVLRRGLDFFSKGVGAIYSALSTGQRALQSRCVAKKLCQIGQMTSGRYPLLGALLRTLDSADLDGYSQALIRGTTIGDCSAVFNGCPE